MNSFLFTLQFIELYCGYFEIVSEMIYKNNSMVGIKSEEPLELQSQVSLPNMKKTVCLSLPRSSNQAISNFFVQS